MKARYEKNDEDIARITSRFHELLRHVEIKNVHALNALIGIISEYEEEVIGLQLSLEIWDKYRSKFLEDAVTYYGDDKDSPIYFFVQEEIEYERIRNAEPDYF